MTVRGQAQCSPIKPGTGSAPVMMVGCNYTVIDYARQDFARFKFGCRIPAARILFMNADAKAG